MNLIGFMYNIMYFMCILLSLQFPSTYKCRLSFAHFLKHMCGFDWIWKNAWPFTHIHCFWEISLYQLILKYSHCYGSTVHSFIAVEALSLVLKFKYVYGFKLIGWIICLILGSFSDMALIIRCGTYMGANGWSWWWLKVSSSKSV